MGKNVNLDKYELLGSIEGVPPLNELRNEPSILHIRQLLPGILICAVVALAALFVSGHYSVPVMLMCLLFGMLFNFLSQSSPTKKGIQFTSQSILRAGVALIGARIMLSDFVSLGSNLIMLVVLITIIVVFLGIFFARILKLDKEQGILIGGATAICGVSAALAISSILPKSKNTENNTLIAVVGVTTMGTIAMIFYPVLIGFVGLDDRMAGILIGGTIHDVSQVVGAGYSVSENAGDVAVLVKLIRVFMLIPVLVALALWFKFVSLSRLDVSTKYPIPWFLVVFIILATINSMHFIPAYAAEFLQQTGKWFLIMAITAVGMKTSLKSIFSLGYKTIFLVLIETVIIFAIYFAYINFI